jgi:hypothetical protein
MRRMRNANGEMAAGVIGREIAALRRPRGNALDVRRRGEFFFFF